MEKMTAKDLAAECKKLEPKFAMNTIIDDNGVLVLAEAPSLRLRWSRLLTGPKPSKDEVNQAELEVLGLAWSTLKGIRGFS